MYKRTSKEVLDYYKQSIGTRLGYASVSLSFLINAEFERLELLLVLALALVMVHFWREELGIGRLRR